jgi:cytochrome c oxidase subunit 2
MIVGYMPARYALFGPLAIVICGLVGLSACAPDQAEEPTGEAAIGRTVAQRAGCMSCHGANGEGGSGPKFVGLADSIVKLNNGSTVVADDAYLAEATTNPQARITAGYSTVMPKNTLTPTEVAQVVAYIRALKGPAGAAASSPTSATK